MLTSRTTAARPLCPPWSHSTIDEPCNFHYHERAVVRYAGTPLCERCALDFAKAKEPFWR